MCLARTTENLGIDSILVCFILFLHKGFHGEVAVYQDFQPSLLISYMKGYLDHRFRAAPANFAQLLTLHQHRDNNQYRMANQM